MSVPWKFLFWVIVLCNKDTPLPSRCRTNWKPHKDLFKRVKEVLIRSAGGPQMFLRPLGNWTTMHHAWWVWDCVIRLLVVCVIGCTICCSLCILCIYHANFLISYLSSTDDFTFTSRRHRGYPFGLTLYINGVEDCRLSACCEYKHPAGARLGGKKGHFGIVGVSGAAPCYKWVWVDLDFVLNAELI